MVDGAEGINTAIAGVHAVRAEGNALRGDEEAGGARSGGAARGKAARGKCSAMAGEQRNSVSLARSAIEAEDAPHIVYGCQISQEGDEIGELGVVRVIEP